MKRKFFFGWLMSMSILCSVSAQQTDQQKRRFVVVPAEQVLVTITFQPDCPLQFEEAKLLAAMDGSEVAGYTVRNTGTKPIRSFTIAVPGGTIGWSDELTRRLFMPGERTPDGDDVEIVPLTDELRDKLKLSGPMRKFVVFMVIRVEYADGSVYSAESAYRALQKYGDDLAELRANRKPR